MWADIHTDTASDAGRLIVLESVGLISIEHESLDQRTKMRARLRRSPALKVHAITGMYLEISRRTPLREVNVVEPVKFKVR